MKTISKISLFLVVLLLLLIPLKTIAQSDTLDDWLIRDFKSDVIVNKDSSADITEIITADCGNLPDKHGIYRVLPTKVKLDNGRQIATPITLKTITDLNGNPYQYSESRDVFSNTLTWKIGSADKTVTGINYYKIIYNVKNVIRAQNSDDEFYWNLSGNDWQIPIEKFSATITFPQNASLVASKIWLYSGSKSAKTAGDSVFKITSPNQIQVNNNTTFNPGEGTTLSASFPKGIFDPYKPTLMDRYGNFLIWIFPLIILIINFLLWWKFGRDPKVHKAIIPEFSIPDNLDPIVMGAVASQGGLGKNSLAAEIINLAVKKYLKITEIPRKNIFTARDYQFDKLREAGKSPELASLEQDLLNAIFCEKKQVNLSEVKDNLRYFYSDLNKKARNNLFEQGYLEKNITKWFSGCVVGLHTLGAIFSLIITLGVLYILFGQTWTSVNTIAVIIISITIPIIFLVLSPKYTAKGAELNHRVRGFKLFIQTAEKYRARFQEKEGIFEKYLPYAILFGLTEIWIKNMRSIYGNDYFTHHPIYFYSGGGGSISDFEGLNSAIAGISSSVSSSTGAGSAGSAGGGGGGGGGGGW